MPDHDFSHTDAFLATRYRAYNTLPDNAIASTFDRLLASGTAATITSGTLRLQSISLPAGVTVSSITFVSGSTALVTGTHQFAAIYDDAIGSSSGTARTLLASSADGTSGAWAASTAKTFTLSTPYTPTRSGFFYVALLVAASTTPTIIATAAANTTLAALSSAIGGNTTDTGLSALPNPCAAPSAAAPIYGYVS